MEPRQISIGTIEEWDQVARILLSYAENLKTFVLQGEIGAGKTTLIQALGRQLGITEAITSPTFSLVNEYSYRDPISLLPKKVYHLDLYRLKSMGEALDIGIEQYLSGEDYCFIEWPEIIQPLLSQDLVVIKITVEADTTRKILFL